MLIIGLTGGSGAGKGEAARCFQQLGIPVIDTDAVYREITSGDTQCLRDIIDEFSAELLNPDGSLDRSKLGSIVFNDEKKRERLNSITHPHILNECRKRIEGYDERGMNAVVVDAPLLYESGFDKECGVVISVMADYDERLRRIVRRDGISVETARNRLKAQLGSDQYNAKADYIIQNNGSGTELADKIRDICGFLGII